MSKAWKGLTRPAKFKMEHACSRQEFQPWVWNSMSLSGQSSNSGFSNSVFESYSEPWVRTLEGSSEPGFEHGVSESGLEHRVPNSGSGTLCMFEPQVQILKFNSRFKSSSEFGVEFNLEFKLKVRIRGSERTFGVLESWVRNSKFRTGGSK